MDESLRFLALSLALALALRLLKEEYGVVRGAVTSKDHLLRLLCHLILQNGVGIC